MSAPSASKNDVQGALTVQLLSDRTLSVAREGYDRRLAAITAAQRGVASRSQLLSAGVPREAIDRRLRSGRLIAVHPSVYRPAGMPASQQLSEETAALLACGPTALLSHHSAATLWGLRAGVARPIHVTVAPGAHHRLRDGVVVHRSALLERDDIRIHAGLPVTSPARTLLDVAAGPLTDRDIERLLDEAIFVRRLTTRAELHGLLRRAGGHPGRARLTRLLDVHTRSTRTESPPEETLLALIRQAKLPEPELQSHVLGYRIDMLWRDERLAVEIDAYGTHGSRASFEKDRQRDLELFTRAGIVTLRLTRNRIESEPLAVIAEISQAREARRPPAGRDP